MKWGKGFSFWLSFLLAAWLLSGCGVEFPNPDDESASDSAADPATYGDPGPDYPRGADGPAPSYQVNIYVGGTSLPDEKIAKAIFSIRSIDYESVSGWQPLMGVSPTQVDLLGHTKGQGHFLGSVVTQAGSISKLRFEIGGLNKEDPADNEQSYLVLNDGSKQSLLVDQKDSLFFEVDAGYRLSSDEPLDLTTVFDLRKSIQQKEQSDYYLRPFAWAVENDKTGSIEVQIRDQTTDSDIIVYVYNSDFQVNRAEMIPEDGSIPFAHAIQSAKPDEMGRFILPWLERGRYDVIITQYIDNEFQGIIDRVDDIKVRPEDEPVVTVIVTLPSDS